MTTTYKPKKQIGDLINRSRGGNFVIFTILAVLGIFSALPLVLMFLQAFKPLNELLLYPPRFFINNPTLKNFSNLGEILNNSWVPLSRYIFNTAFVSVAGTIGHVIVTSMCAYPLTKDYGMPGRNTLFTIVVYSLMISPTVTDIINYQTMTMLNWIDNFTSIIIPILGAPLGLYIMKQFMSQIPDSLIEASRIDGASEFKIFWRIIMPNVKAAWLTVALFSFQGLWNAPNSAYIYSEEKKSLQYAISQISSVGIIRAGEAAAAAVLMLIIPITFFLLTQSRVMEAMATSGMKE